MKLGANSVLFGGHDMETAFKHIAMSGYDGIELSAIGGMSQHLVLDQWKSVAEEIKTLSKAYGLAGLRVGYGVSSPEIIKYMEAVREPFNVNSLAQIGAIGALKDKEFLARSKKVAREGKKFLYSELKAMGVRYVPSVTNFILIELGAKSGEVAENKKQELKKIYLSLNPAQLKRDIDAKLDALYLAYRGKSKTSKVEINKKISVRFFNTDQSLVSVR